MQTDRSNSELSESSIDPPDYYAVLLEWDRAEVASGRRIVVAHQAHDLFNELSEWISTAVEIVYEQTPMRAGHDDFAELFGSLVENYRIPDGIDECLSSADIIPGLNMFLDNKDSGLSHSEDLETILKRHRNIP